MKKRLYRGNSTGPSKARKEVAQFERKTALFQNQENIRNLSKDLRVAL